MSAGAGHRCVQGPGRNQWSRREGWWVWCEGGRVRMKMHTGEEICHFMLCIWRFFHYS